MELRYLLQQLQWLEKMTSPKKQTLSQFRVGRYLTQGNVLVKMGMRHIGWVG